MMCAELPRDELDVGEPTDFAPAAIERARQSAAINRSRLRAPLVRAVPRSRLDALLDRVWDHRATLIVAPAGSGKTTAAAEFATRSGRRVAWFTCTGVDSGDAFVAHLNAALTELMTGLVVVTPGPEPDLESTLEALLHLTEPVALVVDDVHLLVGTPAEAVLRHVVEDAPESLRLVLSGRREPGFDLAPIRLMGQLLTIGTEELRFRAWEAEQLFRDLYDTWLRPDDIARLARRVDGWAAGLQMFHLAARGLSPVEQRRLIERLSGRARIVREYLVANVLGPISPSLRTFLIDTCVFGVVSPELADELRGSPGSAQHLRELAASQLFTVAVDDDNYRYHEVLRAQLEVMLLERDGEDAAADRYRRAGRLLERRGQHHDALHCYARAGDWSAVRRLAGPTSDQIRPPTMAWLTDLPSSIVADDPWLLLARSRAERLAGRWNDAMESIRAAAARGIGADFADQVRPQTAALTAWLDPLALAPGPDLANGWIGAARAGCRREPLVAAAELERRDDAEARVAGSALRLLGGDVVGARETAANAVGDETVGPIGVAAGLAVLAFTGLLEGRDGSASRLDAAETYAERAGFGWLARIVRAGLALTDRPSGVDEAIRVRDQCLADGDPWGAAISSLLGGLGAARRGTPANQLLNQAGQRFRTLQARSFEALASVALATCGGAAADEASALGRSTGTAAMRPLIERFIGVSPSTDSVPSIHVHATTPIGADDADVGPLRVQCLGRFHIAVCGTELDLDCLRPRARNLLKLLAIHPDSGVHRETIVEALWPDGTAESGIRNLHVAASAVRRALATAGLPEQFGVRRQGEAYRLVLPSTEASDLAHFLELAAAARAAAARDDHDEAMAAAGAALALYGGELLIEDGPLEFAVRERSRVAALHQSVAAIAAGELLRRSDHRAAIDTCEATILEHPYADELWRLLVRAHHERGDLAAAGQAQSRYDHVLAELMA